MPVGIFSRSEGGRMKEKKPLSLDLEVQELERGRKPGGCLTSSTTSNLCTCPCIPPPTIDCVAKV
jgi:hypothetical protein